MSTAGPSVSYARVGEESKNPPKRSKAGCLTCRKRKKACDETRHNGGSCERCFKSAYRCEWPLPPEARPLREFKKGERKAARAAKAQEPSADGEGARAPHGAPSPHPPGATASSVFPSIAPRPPPLAQEQPPFSLQPSQSLLRTLAPAPQLGEIAPAVQSSSFSSSSSAPPAEPFPSSSTFAPLSFDLSSDPFAPPVSLFNPGEELNSFFASLDSEFFDSTKWDAALGTSSGTGATPNWGESPAEGGLAELLGSEALALAVGSSTERATRAEQLPIDCKWSLLPSPCRAKTDIPPSADDDLNQNFFLSLPKPVRKVVCERFFAMATSNESSQSAAMAMVMLYRLRKQQQQQRSSDPAEAAAAAEIQAKLLQAGNSYFQRSLDSLASAGKEVPFEAKLLSTLDLVTYQFDQYGNAACHAVLTLAEFFIVEALGPQPMLELSAQQEGVQTLLSMYAWTDVLRSLTTPKRRPLFSYPAGALPGDSSASSPWVQPPCALATHLGFPAGLMFCFAAVANLAAEADALPDAVITVKVEAIEQAIREWRFPNPPDASELQDGLLYVEKVATAEMWRNAALIYLYQALGRGPLYSGILAAVSQILSIGSRLLHTHIPTGSVLDSSDSSSSTTTPAAAAPKEEYIKPSLWRDGPWFLAGTCALLPRDRELCRQGVKACGKMQGYRDNLAALERIWKEADEKGWWPDWREFCAREKLFVGFA
ncbi:hypothetical protein JCM10213_005812 [Rhodosporidiobolus nylandii]